MGGQRWLPGSEKVKQPNVTEWHSGRSLAGNKAKSGKARRQTMSDTGLLSPATQVRTTHSQRRGKCVTSIERRRGCLRDPSGL